MDHNGAIIGAIDDRVPHQMGTSIEPVPFHQCAISHAGARMAALLAYRLYFRCVLVLNQTGFCLLTGVYWSVHKSNRTKSEKNHGKMSFIDVISIHILENDEAVLNNYLNIFKWCFYTFNPVSYQNHTSPLWLNDISAPSPKLKGSKQAPLTKKKKPNKKQKKTCTCQHNIHIRIIQMC